MKKHFLSLFVAAFGLVGCSSGVDNLKPVSAGSIKQLCLKGNIRSAPEDFVESLTRSLKNKNIAAQFVKKDGDCDHILFFSVKGNSKVIARARLDVRDMNNNKQSVGSLTYKRRGDEKDRVDQVGLQGQTDLMVNQLFQ